MLRKGQVIEMKLIEKVVEIEDLILYVLAQNLRVIENRFVQKVNGDVRLVNDFEMIIR
jgi:hypothetical protein